MIDAKYRFIWANVGAPGNTHDSILFQSTKMWAKIVSGDVLPNKTSTINNIDIPPLILGDGAFPPRTWLAKPYGDAILTPEKRYFNYRLSRSRMIVEGGFGQLKGRYRVLGKKCESSKNTVKKMALASIVLHNICISRSDTVPRYFDITLDEIKNKRRPQDNYEICSI